MKDVFFQSPEIKAEIAKNARVKLFQEDQLVIKPGEEILFVPFVLKGSIRVLRQNDAGEEVFLYHLQEGETCAMSLSCCQAGVKSMVKAIAETSTEILQIPVNLMQDWMKFPEWKTFVSQTYQKRFAELLEVIDLISFRHLDEQILHYLKERAKAQGSNTILIKHQQIADELHTHREVVSRLLRSMENKKMLKLGRNSIELLF